MTLGWIDYSLLILYLGGLLYLGIQRRLRSDSSASELIVGGRLLTLPAFVASLVSTWYGGILVVGEYSFQYGISNWLVFGVPYYIAAFLFALFLAKKARESKLLTVPERLAITYDNKTAIAGSVVLFLMTVPSTYILILGVLVNIITGYPLWVGISFGTLFSIVYVYLGGFASVVRTDLLQFGLMFIGFAVMLIVLVINYGGYQFIVENVPVTHLTWHGGNDSSYIIVWYFIALSTLIEPAFFQRCYATKKTSTARNGIFVSIVCWAIFDFLTTSCGLYARALLPHLKDPLTAFPELAGLVLPAGLLGLFILALLATVMSTVDSYSFLAASTFSHDIVGRFRKLGDKQLLRMTRIGLLLSAGLAVAFALFFRSGVAIWHAFGSIGTPALLVPVFFSFVGKRRMPAQWAFLSIVLCGGLSAIWLGASYFRDGSYWFGIRPIFPGLMLSLLFYLLFSQADDTIDLRITEQENNN